MPLGGCTFGALPIDSGALGLAVEGVHAGFDGEKEMVRGDEVMGGAIEVAAMAGDGLVDQAGFVGGELFDPLHEDEVVGEVGTFEGVFDTGGGGADGGADAGFPGWVHGELAGVEVVFAGVA